MYTNDHVNRYRMLPINIDHAFVDAKNDKYSSYFIKSPDSDTYNCFSSHRHEAIEFIYVQEGEIIARLDDRAYTVKEGDLLVVNPFIDHVADCQITGKNMRYRVIQFELSAFNPPMSSKLQSCILGLLNGNGHFKEHIQASRLEMTNVKKSIDLINERWKGSEISPQNDCLQLAAVYELLADMISEFYVNAPISGRVKRDLHFIRVVIDYLYNHYKEPLSTSGVSENLSYNLNHFCRVFRANFGTSFTKYLAEFRLTQAINNYRYSTLMINEIAAAVGFQDYGYFAQIFKKYTGISPTTFFLGSFSQNEK